jgi:hypothetical protein
MPFSSITASQILPGKAAKAELFSKIKDNLDDHETRLLTVEAGIAAIEIFNFDVVNASSGVTMTGMIHHEALFDFTVTKVKVQIFEKGSISSGTLEIDIKKNSTLDDTGMTSILTTKPIIDFSTDPDYTEDIGVLNASEQDVLEGEFLRLDVTALPTLPLSKFRVLVYGVV